MKHDLSQNQQYDAYLQDPSLVPAAVLSTLALVMVSIIDRQGLCPALQMPQGSALESPSGRKNTTS